MFFFHLFMQEVSTEIQIQPVDVNTMIPELPLPKMVLENMDIGRGRGIPKGMDGYHVITLDVKTWHVHENQSILLPDESFGQFHSGTSFFSYDYKQTYFVVANNYCGYQVVSNK